MRDGMELSYDGTRYVPAWAAEADHRALAAIDALHYPREWSGIEYCASCVSPWPCPTRQVIDKAMQP